MAGGLPCCSTEAQPDSKNRAIKNFRMAASFRMSGPSPGQRLPLFFRRGKVFCANPPLSASPRKFLVAISPNPGHMPPWCCPAGSRGANRRARCGSRQCFKPWLRIGTTAAFPATWAAFPSRLSRWAHPMPPETPIKRPRHPSILGAFLSSPLRRIPGPPGPFYRAAIQRGCGTVRAGMGQRPRG